MLKSKESFQMNENVDKRDCSFTLEGNTPMSLETFFSTLDITSALYLNHVVTARENNVLEAIHGFWKSFYFL